MKRTVPCVLISLSLLIVNLNLAVVVQANSEGPLQSTLPQNPKADKIQKAVEKIGLGEDITVILMDGTELYGHLRQIEADSFTLFEVDQRQLLTTKYSEVKKVRKGYGGKNSVTGKRVNPKKATVGRILAAAAIAIPVLIAVISLSRED